MTKMLPIPSGAIACHALEIPFVFDTLDAGPTQMLGELLGDRPPQELASAMHSAWVSFIAGGDAGWPEYEVGRRDTMRFDTVSRVVADPRAAETSLWEGTR
jgi:para-nitrobenzyl esterase